MKIEMLGVDALIPYVNNARVHSDEQVTQIASSIKEFGFNVPILIDKDKGVIAGHGRLMAAKKLGQKQVPCIRIEHLTDTQKKAYILADNKIALNSDWDVDLLRLELSELDSQSFNLDLTGFVGQDLTEALFGKNSEKGEGDYFDVDETSTEQAGPKATDDDYSVYELIMKHENKTLLISALNKIKSEHSFEKQEDALMHLVKSYF